MQPIAPLLFCVASLAGAQSAIQPGQLHGVVRATGGAPVASANVFILETLDGVLTDSAGRFTIGVRTPYPVTLVARRIGFQPLERPVSADDAVGEIVIMLATGVTALARITVQAGAYTASEERGATLTPLEVVTTPGTSADIHRAIQLLPGLQAVDDGTALFVRGGDFTETKVFLNEAPLLNPAQLLTPSGTFVGTVDPFQLDGIFFSSGGFGARYGNALSGVVGLRTRGRATRRTATLGAGLAALSADLAVPIGPAFAVRLAANRLDLNPFLRVNSNPRGFVPPPHGRDLSVSATLNYRPGGEVKAFLIDQTNLVGVAVDDPSYSGTFMSDVGSRLAVLTWRDVLGKFLPQLSVSESRLAREEEFGAFQLSASQVLRQIFAQVDVEPRANVTVRVGGEVERLTSDLSGALAADVADRGPSARRVLFTVEGPGTRVGAFAEADLRMGSTLRLIPGLRADRSTLTHRTTVDPRVNAAWRPAAGITVTAAWGLYHQVPDPLFFADSIGQRALPPMRAEQRVVGLQLGNGAPALVRVEVYDKRYHDLAQQTREFRAVGGGVGRSHGVDLFAKGRLPYWNLETRTTTSVLRARRTDPTTGVTAPASFDVRRSHSFILERPFANGTRAGLAYRSGSGRPFTPIDGGTYDAARDLYLPRYGDPFSDRFPSLRRLDLSLSRFRPLTPHVQAVGYVSVSNVLNRTNVQGWRYSRDYTVRSPVPSIFNRSVYFGASLIMQ